MDANVKLEWVAIFEMGIALIIAFVLWSFLEGPFRRLAHGLHDHSCDGRLIRRGHRDYDDYCHGDDRDRD